jgi:hypothetical protein
MQEIVQKIIDDINSSVALKNEDQNPTKFAIKINFDFSIGDFTVDVVG